MSPASQRLEKTKNVLAAATVFLLPLKLSFAYAVLLPFLFIWVIQNFRNYKHILSPSQAPVIWPLIVFVILSALSSLLGFDPLRSLQGLLGLSFLIMFVPALADVGQSVGFLKLLLLLIAGQSLAAYHSVLEGAFPSKAIFIGKVSESGQLALTWMLAFGLMLELRRKLKSQDTFRLLACLGALNLMLLSALAFSEHFALGVVLRCGLTCFVLLVLIIAIYKAFRMAKEMRQHPAHCYFYCLAVIALPLLSAALLVNLKRGPWAGVLMGALVLLISSSRKLAGSIIALSLLLSVGLEPIRTRIEQAPRDFFIEGGRATIWEIGADLATRYPLGVGFNNSSFLRNYSTHIPKDNTHFHSNLLNILVETGVLGFVVFIWWILVLFKEALKKYRYAKINNNTPGSGLPLVMGTAILSWQIAGTVEYNFGDTEVLLVVLCVLAFLSQAQRLQDEATC